MVNKKADQTLNMIFGLFILLIISLVVLSLFFKFTEKSSGTMTETQETFFSKQQLQTVQNDCAVLCSEITGVDTAISFCKKYQRMDMDGDKMVSPSIKADLGRWSFCEDRVPCFILTTCEFASTAYDGAKCKQILHDNRLDFYTQLEYLNASATCGLSTIGEEAKANWVFKYGFYVGAP